jgi:hypothetical protein
MKPGDPLYLTGGESVLAVTIKRVHRNNPDRLLVELDGYECWLDAGEHNTTDPAAANEIVRSRLLRASREQGEKKNTT